MHEMSEVRTATEDLNRSKTAAEKANKALVVQLNDLNKKTEAAALSVADMENCKRKFAAENSDLLRQLQELETSANMITTVNKD